MKTPAMGAPGRAGRGAVDQKFVKYLSESPNFVKKNANSIFFWNPREWNAWLSVVQSF